MLAIIKFPKDTSHADRTLLAVDTIFVDRSLSEWGVSLTYGKGNELRPSLQPKIAVHMKERVTLLFWTKSRYAHY